MSATIKGIVFHDVHHMGLYTSSLKGIGEVVLVLETPHQGYLTTSTDTSGNFSFPDLTFPGTYHLYEVGDTPQPIEELSPHYPLLFGYNNLTTPRHYVVTLSEEQVHTEVVLDYFYFGYEFVEAFEPSLTAYQVHPTKHQLYHLNSVTGKTIFSTDLSSPGDYHTLTYHPVTHYLYGYDEKKHQLFRINPYGIVTYYNVFSLPQRKFSACAIDATGHLYLYEALDYEYYVVNLDCHSPYFMSVKEVVSILPLAISSWAFYPQSNLLYTVNTDGCVLKIDAASGEVIPLVTTGTPLAPSVGLFFDYSGHLYCLLANTPTIYHLMLKPSEVFAEVFTSLERKDLVGFTQCCDLPLTLHYGSAPDYSPAHSETYYSTSLANNGPRHLLTHSLLFGDCDTTNFTLELPPLLLSDSQYSIEVPIINRTQVDAYVYGWLDLNQNGIFERSECSEPVTIPSDLTKCTKAILTFNIPRNQPIVVGKSYCRLRLTTDTLIASEVVSSPADTRSLGAASDGQVFDLPFTITGLPPIGNDTLYEVCYQNKELHHTLVLADPCHGKLSYTLIKPPLHGYTTMDSTTSHWCYVPDLDYLGEDSFVIRATSSVSGLYTDSEICMSVLLAELKMHLEVSHLEATPEHTLTYTATLENTGNITLDHLVLSDLLPFGCYFVSESVNINKIAMPHVNLATPVTLEHLAPHERYTLSFSCMPSADMTSISACYRVEYRYPLLQTQTSPTLVTSIKHPTLTLNLELSQQDALASDVVYFKCTLCNTGDLCLDNLHLYPRLDTLLTYQEDLLVDDEVPYARLLPHYIVEKLEPNASTVLTFSVHVGVVASTTSLESFIKVDYSYLLDEATYVKSLKSDIRYLTVHMPNLTLTKTPSKTYVSLHEVFNYTFTAFNGSDLVVDDVTLVDAIPSYFEILEIVCDKELLTNTLTSGLSIGRIEPHESKVITVLLRAIKRSPTQPAESLPSQGSFSILLPKSNVLKEMPVKTTVTEEVYITDAGLSLKLSLSSYQSSIGESLNYTLHLTNTGTITLSEVLIQDLLSPELKFVPHSVTLNQQPMEHASIISGVTLTNLAINASATLSFQVMVIEKVSKEVDCTLCAHYTYGLVGMTPMKTNHTTSNVCKLLLHYVGVEISGTIAQSVAFLNDVVTYTLQIQNVGDTPVFNVVLSNTSASYELVDRSFKLNDTCIHSVSLLEGINLGSIPSGDTLYISYSQKISNQYYPFELLTSTLAAHFSYTTYDSTLKYGDSNVLNLVIPLSLSTFKQFELESYFELTDTKPDIEMINAVSGQITLLKHYTIKTPTATSVDGQHLTTHTLLFHGLLDLTLEYVSDEVAHSIYTSYHTLPFSSYIVLPEDFPAHAHIRINSTLQDVSFKLINNRSFFASVSILAVAYIK